MNVLTIVVIHYFSWWASFRSSESEVFYKKDVLKISQIWQQKTCASGLQLIEKETLLQVFEFCETFKSTFFNRTPLVLTSGIFF